jgi:hypothetical protein
MDELEEMDLAGGDVPVVEATLEIQANQVIA